MGQKHRARAMSRIPYPAPASPLAWARMRRNRRFDTDVELSVRSELHRRGLHFRVHVSISSRALTLTPDIVFCEAGLQSSRIGVSVTHARITGQLHATTRIIGRRRGWSVIANATAPSISRWPRPAGILRIWEHVPVAAAANLIASTIASRLRLDDVDLGTHDRN